MRGRTLWALLVAGHSLQGGTSAAAPPSTAPSSSSLAAEDPRQGIVRLEQGGRRIGYGAVLRSDGRIITALSALGHGNFVRARYADDRVLGVRVVATDRAWDLALLAPEGMHWVPGLRASSVDAAAEGVRLRRFAGPGPQLHESVAAVSGRQVLLGGDGVLLEGALLLDDPLGPSDLGGPIVDERGDVVSIVAQACDPRFPQDCRLEPFGVPVPAIKAFLRGVPTREPLPAAWLGIRGVAADSGSVSGVRVVAVAPGSPAEAAGLRASGGDGSGDLIVAVDDVPVTTPEELSDVVHRIALTGSPTGVSSGPASASPGSGATSIVMMAPEEQGPQASSTPPERQLRLLVFGSGRFRQVSLPLRAPTRISPPAPAAPPAAASSPLETGASAPTPAPLAPTTTAGGPPAAQGAPRPATTPSTTSTTAPAAGRAAPAAGMTTEEPPALRPQSD